MRISRNWSRFAVLLTLMALIGAACSSKTKAPAASKPTITVGSANFAESITLADIYAQVLEAKGYKVVQKENVGSREIYEPALESGTLSFVPDYLNSMLEFLKGTGSADVQTDVTAIQPLLAAKGLTALDPAPAQDKNEFAVTKATADKYHLTKISDLAPVASKLVLGGPPECPTRPLCEKGLEDKYGLHFKSFKSLDTGGPLTVAALKNGKIDVGLLFTTDTSFITEGFVRLEDDKGLQGADNVVPIVRQNVVTAYGDSFKTLINSISAKLTTDEVLQLNKAVIVDKKDSKDVARAWLVKEGFVS
ncbi:MAG: ABC transporter substrate-binding protein [Actinobacteria bacterium]|nr:MAG: ABC transporter substrate-binding protein [Actinomycetota bacterium]